MSQLVYQTPSGGSITMTAIDTASNFGITVPAKAGNMLLDSSLATPPVIGATTPAAATFTDLTSTGLINFTGTGAVLLNAGTTGQRPVGVAGQFRFNTSFVTLEGYNGTTWGSVGGATGGGGNQVFYENGQIVSTNYTITSGKSAMSTGPITVNSGVAITVPSGSRYVIL